MGIEETGTSPHQCRDVSCPWVPQRPTQCCHGAITPSHTRCALTGPAHRVTQHLDSGQEGGWKAARGRRARAPDQGPHLEEAPATQRGMPAGHIKESQRLLEGEGAECHSVAGKVGHERIWLHPRSQVSPWDRLPSIGFLVSCRKNQGEPQ